MYLLIILFTLKLNYFLHVMYNFNIVEHKGQAFCSPRLQMFGKILNNLTCLLVVILVEENNSPH